MTEDDFTEQVELPARRRVRTLARRWRLWWRFQVRTLRWRGFPRRWRVLREPGPETDVVFAQTQLRVGRLLGRGYAKADRLGERARIERARVPDRIEPAQTAVALARHQAPLLRALLAFIVIGLVLDTLARAVGPDVASALGVDSWLRDTFTRPSEDTLRNLLAAAAGGTATILGLVLSISLIVWQSTADRYRSTSIVAFLLRERVGSVVVRLLALGFTYSLWVLAVLELFGGRPPYVSAGIALLLSTLAAVSLLSYREVGLLGYMPANIARSLRLEIVREIRRAQRSGAGRSVEDYARRVVRGDLQIFRDLLVRLGGERDAADAVAVVAELDLVLQAYLRTKHRLEPENMFFVRRGERLPASGVDIESSLIAEGLMNPTAERPDLLWLERSIVEIAGTAKATFDDRDVTERVLRMWTVAVQLAVHLELDDVAELVIDVVEPWAIDSRFIADRQLSQDYLEFAWILIELAGGSEGTSAEQIVETEPWKNDKKLRALAWSAQEEARDLGRRISRELGIAGHHVTPRDRMAEEVAARRASIFSQRRDQLVARAVALYKTHFLAAVATRSLASPPAARMAVRILLRMAHHGLSVDDDPELNAALFDAASRAESVDLEDLRKDTGTAARRLAEAEQWSAAYGMTWVNAVITRLAVLKVDEPLHQTALLFDALFTTAVVYAWGELRQVPGVFAATRRFVDSPYVNLDALASMLEEHRLPLLLPNVNHIQWFQSLRRAVFDLPQRVDARRGRFGRSVRDHPSALFQTDDMLFGPDHALAHLVERTVTVREQARVRLISALVRVLEART